MFQKLSIVLGFKESLEWRAGSFLTLLAAFSLDSGLATAADGCAFGNGFCYFCCLNSWRLNIPPGPLSNSSYKTSVLRLCNI